MKQNLVDIGKNTSGGAYRDVFRLLDVNPTNPTCTLEMYAINVTFHISQSVIERLVTRYCLLDVAGQFVLDGRVFLDVYMVLVTFLKL